MKQVTKYGLLFIAIVFLISCNNKRITNRKDYASYLQASAKKTNMIDQDIAFWQKRLQENPGHLGAQSKIAGLLTKRFQYSGNINEIKQADSIYKIVNQTQKRFSASVYRNLASNAVTQHQFWQSKYYLDSAAQLGDNLSFTILQQSDVQLELGDLYAAKRLLKRYPQQHSVEVLIRLAKISDHEGNLDEAIELMEKALSKVTVQNDESSYTWLKSNLGDFYAHANRFRESYNAYLDVLRIDPENYHCLKGIAWLAFSHDKKIKEAKEIARFLKQQHPVPDYDLLLADIAAYENDIQLSEQYTKEFISAVTKETYGDMYNKYLFSLYADELNDIETAFEIAKTETKNRPTGESYSLLSWAYYKKGNYTEALRIAKSFVENKCFEPDAAYHLAMIYKANGDKKMAKKYFKEVKSSLFELGPGYTSKLN